MGGSGGGDIPAFGYFSTPVSIGVGDPYVKKLPPDARYTGKQLQTSPSKRGQTGGNWNEPRFDLVRLYEGEKFVDPGQTETKARLQSKEKNLTKDGFKPSSPAKKWSGLGSHFGAIGPQLEHSVDGFEKRDKRVPEPRQVQTSPSKKGSYGTIGTTIGESLKYAADPFDRPHKLELEEAEQDRKKRLSGAFRSMSKGVDYFDSHPNVAASKVYTLDKPMPPVKQRPRTSPEIKTPFIPSQLPKIGYNATLTPFPEYKESPYDSQLKKDREYSHEQKKKVIGGAYRPTSHPKSTPQASIVALNVTYHSIDRS